MREHRTAFDMYPDPMEPSESSRHARVRRRARDWFDQWAHSYDRSRLNELIFFPTLRLCQEEVLRWQALVGPRPFRVLDVGCGTGTLLSLLARQPKTTLLVGLDYSPAMIRCLAEKIARSPHGAKLHAVVADAERLPFPDESFDVLTCCNSFHHYPHQAEVIREFQRVLRPEGVLILVDGFRDNVVGWIVFDVGVAWVEGHVHHARWSEVRDMIQASGFATLRQRKVNVLAPLLVNVALR
jgi:ubiquinone/menaquinone biosynthesis C-methylase UbiE